MYIHKKNGRRLPVSLPKSRFLGGPVKVTDAATGELKRWESPNGKTLALIENGKLVLTALGKRLGYRVKGYIVEAP